MSRIPSVQLCRAHGHAADHFARQCRGLSGGYLSGGVTHGHDHFARLRPAVRHVIRSVRGRPVDPEQVIQRPTSDRLRTDASCFRLQLLRLLDHRQLLQLTTTTTDNYYTDNYEST